MLKTTVCILVAVAMLAAFAGGDALSEGSTSAGTDSALERERQARRAAERKLAELMEAQRQALEEAKRARLAAERRPAELARALEEAKQRSSTAAGD